MVRPMLYSPDRMMPSLPFNEREGEWCLELVKRVPVDRSRVLVDRPQEAPLPDHSLTVRATCIYHYTL
jgi:hypothetical protein